MRQKAKFSGLFSFSITGQDILKLFTSQNKRGCNPLMTAAEFESNDVLQFLLNFLKGFVISKGIFNLVGSIIKKWTKTLFFNCLLLTTEPPKIRDLRNRSFFLRNFVYCISLYSFRGNYSFFLFNILSYIGIFGVFAY